MPGPAFALSPDGRAVAIRLSEHPDITAHLTTAEVDALIERLALARRAMQPAVPKTQDLGRQRKGTREPSWVLEGERHTLDPILHLRDPGLGWRCFGFSRETAMRLVTALTTLLDQQRERRRPH